MSTLVAGCGGQIQAVEPVEPTYVAPIVDSCAINKQLAKDVNGHKVVYNVRADPEQCKDKTFGFAYIIGGDSWSHVTYGKQDGKLTARVAGPLEGPVSTANLLKQKSTIYECVNEGSKFDCEFRDKASLLDYDRRSEAADVSAIDSVGTNIRAGTAAANAKFGYELMSELFKN